MGDHVAESNETVAPSVPSCAKSMKFTPRITLSAPIARTAIVPVEGIRAEGLGNARVAKVVVPIRKEAMWSYERAMATYRVDFSEAMKFAPKDFKVMVKVKPPAMPARPAITNCAFRKALSPEKVKQLRAAWSFAFEAAAAESAEKGEL
jgi:hypothetical protein